jgi:hypothetical protein
MQDSSDFKFVHFQDSLPDIPDSSIEARGKVWTTPSARALVASRLFIYARIHPSFTGGESDC